MLILKENCNIEKKHEEAYTGFKNSLSFLLPEAEHTLKRGGGRLVSDPYQNFFHQE